MEENELAKAILLNNKLIQSFKFEIDEKNKYPIPKEIDSNMPYAGYSKIPHENKAFIFEIPIDINEEYFLEVRNYRPYERVKIYTDWHVNNQMIQRKQQEILNDNNILIYKNELIDAQFQIYDIEEKIKIIGSPFDNNVKKVHTASGLLIFKVSMIIAFYVFSKIENIYVIKRECFDE